MILRASKDPSAKPGNEPLPRRFQCSENFPALYPLPAHLPYLSMNRFLIAVTSAAFLAPLETQCQALKTGQPGSH